MWFSRSLFNIKYVLAHQTTVQNVHFKTVVDVICTSSDPHVTVLCRSLPSCIALLLTLQTTYQLGGGGGQGAYSRGLVFKLSCCRFEARPLCSLCVGSVHSVLAQFIQLGRRQVHV